MAYFVLEKYRSLVIAGIGVAVFQQFRRLMLFYYIPADREKATGHAASDLLMWPDHPRNHFSCWFFCSLVIADKFNRQTLLKIGG